MAVLQQVLNALLHRSMTPNATLLFPLLLLLLQVP
jgi:hypothetical protein